VSHIPARTDLQPCIMGKPLMLWFDCTSRSGERELRQQCAAFFEISYCAQLANAEREIKRLAPRVLCFDFDYPSQRQLRSLQSIKQKHVSLPALMFTVEHSEALAVWAFRARVWNYLVKPVALAEVGENLRSLMKVLNTERRTTRALTLPAPEVPEQVPNGAPEDTQELLLPGIYYIQQHFNERMAAEDVAQMCGMNRFRFSRRFHRALGMTFQEYLLRYRVRQACQLLLRPRVSVTEVGYSVGFNDASYFTRIFKRYMKMLPSQFAASADESQRVNASRADLEFPAAAVPSL
jgi:AraC-like DNA-binding protein